MLRKLFFTGVLIFVVPGSPSQIVIAILAGLAWLVFCTQARAVLETWPSFIQSLHSVALDSRGVELSFGCAMT